MIDIGSPAIERPTDLSHTYTWISLENPANEDGDIAKIEIWPRTNMSGLKVGTFYGTPPNLTSRDWAALGDALAGGKRIFEGLAIEVKAGDYLGYYAAGGYGGADSDSPLYSKAGDQFGTGLQHYTQENWVGPKISLYGEGAAPAKGRSLAFIIG